MKSLFLLSLITLSASAAPVGIYGEDNRHDVYAATNPLFVSLARSTAAMIHKDHLIDHGYETKITASSYGDFYKLCPEERFRFQPIAANCSGSLVAPDIIMTAAHCYDLIQETCKSYSWVFDYKVSKERQSEVTVPSSNVYECDEVILHEMDLARGTDHALIRLKRSVLDRPVAKLRSEGKIKVNDPLVLIGHPRGLPTKIADGAYVLSVDKNLFVSNLDAYTVNSGSAVFNASSGEVEGILSSGSMDFSFEDGCTVSKVLKMEEGNETVVKVDAIQSFLNKQK